MELTQAVWNDLVHAIMHQTNGTRERAEDAVQTAYMKMLEKTEPIRDEMGFLILVARRKYFSSLKKESRLSCLSNTAANIPSAEYLEDSFHGEAGYEALAALARGEKERDVADALGKTRHQVRMIKKRWVQG